MYIQTRTYVAAYRFIADYKAITVLSFSSIGSILRACWKLPSIPSAPIGSPHTPFVLERQRRRLILGIGILTIIANGATIWLHSRVPPEIGHVTTPSIDIEAFRSQLEWFLGFFTTLVVFQAVFWFLLSRISQKDQK
jgi:hypothetical protein